MIVWNDDYFNWDSNRDSSLYFPIGYIEKNVFEREYAIFEYTIFQ